MAGLTCMAQDDVSQYVLINNGFDLNFNYDNALTGNVKGDVINEVFGWTNETTATYTVAGTFAYNPNVTLNGSSALPSAGYENSSGGCLGLTTGWGMELAYSQTVTLPKGTYKLTSAYYNVGTSTRGMSLLAWLPDGGAEVKSAVKNFPVGEWTTDELSFTLTATTKGRIRIGLATSESTGSANHAKVLVDYVKLLCSDIDKGELRAVLNTAVEVYGNGSGIGASDLKKVIDAAKTVYDDAGAKPADIIKYTAELSKETTKFVYRNATFSKPVDVTNLVANPSFEENGTAGWENIGFVTQTNNNFTGKKGNVYVEKWVNIGSKVPDVSIMQTLKGIPDGVYRMTAATSNIQQTGSGSTTNQGAAQTGVNIVGGFFKAPVNTMTSDNQLQFTVVGGETTIGMVAENASGNWVCFDNVRLEYLGEATDNYNREYLNLYCDYLRKLITDNKLQNSVWNDANYILTSLAGMPINYDFTVSAKESLDKVTAKVLESIALVDELEDAIVYAGKVREWYKDDADKVSIMDAAITTANTALGNMDMADSEIDAAVKALKAETAKVDKKVHIAQWMMGDVNDPNNAYSWDRTIQTRDWILFWEKGYGAKPKAFVCGSYVVDVDGILEHAEKAFDYYTDVLKFVDRKTSKMNTYKMVIRLRYEPKEWEATGSGVDDTIGLLTLTPWAASSRNWQTLYHEVGHCFQYQVHCDNGDQNGWMYNPGGGTGNGFWEQCAQWQAYKIMPDSQFNNEWFDGYLKNVHKHILHESPRYNNFFIQDYWAYRHGKDYIGRMWNESKSPEDACQAYMRMNNLTVSQFYDEMYDCAAQFATWDIPELARYGKSKIDSRPTVAMVKEADNYLRISKENTPENTGHNILRLNLPEGDDRNVEVSFVGLTDHEDYNYRNVEKGEWRYGFVAYLNDNTRVYGEMGKSTYADPEGISTFEVPVNTKRLYFVVSGGSSEYWPCPWDGTEANNEQWPYKVLFGNTNLRGNTSNPHLSGVDNLNADEVVADIRVSDGMLTVGANGTAMTLNVYSVSGVCVANCPAGMDEVSVSLPQGVYVVRLVTSDGRTAKTCKVAVK